jgi:predicted N-acetyltransferase YhbS
VDVIIREERQSERGVIKLVNYRAFDKPEAGELIDRLRQKPGFISELSLVAEMQGIENAEKIVVGHILFFPVSIVSPTKQVKTLSLLRLSVLPEYQGQGIGSDLVTGGIERARDLGFTSLVLVGAPEYFTRFGFSAGEECGISLPAEFSSRGKCLVNELVPGALHDISGVVEFPEECKAV